jgi:hypothetical protein
MWVAAKMLMAGYKVAYAAEALVYHSHNYSFQAEFQRYFDTGVFHVQAPWLIEIFGSVKNEGLKMLKAQLHLVGRGLVNHSQSDVDQGMLVFTDPVQNLVLRSHEQFQRNLQKTRLNILSRLILGMEVIASMTIKLIAYRFGRLYGYLLKNLS